MIRAKERVPSGNSLQDNDGEISSPSQVYLTGTRPPSSNAPLLSFIDIKKSSFMVGLPADSLAKNEHDTELARSSVTRKGKMACRIE
jgi:hypothetical protein